MSRICAVCGKSCISGNKVSHSNIKTRRTWKANLHKVRRTDESGRSRREYVCARCLRTERKKGATD